MEFNTKKNGDWSKGKQIGTSPIDTTTDDWYGDWINIHKGITRGNCHFTSNRRFQQAKLVVNIASHFDRGFNNDIEIWRWFACWGRTLLKLLLVAIDLVLNKSMLTFCAKAWPWNVTRCCGATPRPPKPEGQNQSPTGTITVPRLCWQEARGLWSSQSAGMGGEEDAVWWVDGFWGFEADTGPNRAW